MKNTLIVLVLAVAAVQFSSAASVRTRRQLVPAEFRNINIENYLKNPRSVLFQLKCIVYDGPCDRIGKYLKVTIPDLITGTCAHCTPSDRQTAGRLVAHIQKNFPKEWHDAVRKFQGGQSVKPEDASKFESLLGVKLDAEFVSSTAAPAIEASSSTTAAPAEIAPVVSSSPAPASVAPAVVASTSTTTGAPLQPKVEEKKAVPVVEQASPSVDPVVVADAVVPTEAAPQSAA